MTTKKDYFLKTLHVISWIIFIGLCIEAGGFIFNVFFTFFINPEGAQKFWTHVNLSELYNFNQSHFVTLTSIMIIVTVLKALMFYFIVELFHNKKFDLSYPFNENVKRFIAKIAYLVLGIGLFSFWGSEFVENLVKEGIKLPVLQNLKLAGADVWFFMGILLLVIAQVFQKGIELQNENDLTI